MFDFLKKDRGFSLVEMMIVVAIMGILSAVVSTSLTKARPKARLGSAQAQMSSLHPSLIICLNDLQTIDFTSTAPVVGDKICATANDTAVFQALPGHWSYTTSSVESTIKAVSDEGNLWEIECSDSGCATTTPPPTP